MDESRAAMVLCAGLGTRLRPLTDERAKPMVPIGDRPALAHVIERVRLAAPNRVVVNVHHRPEDVRTWADEQGIRVSDERELLGTAGGLEGARELLGDGDVLVWNGDILSELDPRELFAAHEGVEGGAAAGVAGGLAARAASGDGVAARAAVGATLAVVARPAGEGNVGISAEGAIVRLRGERFGEEAQGGAFVGIHVVGAALRRRLPARGCLVGDVYLPALRRGERLRAHVVATPFVDVGSLAEYLAANRTWLAARGVASWAAPTAEVHASIEGSVVGADARVLAPAVRSVIWPGAVVERPVTAAVVTTAGIVAQA